MLVIVELVLAYIMAEVIGRREYPVTAICDQYGVDSNYYLRESAVAGWTVLLSVLLSILLLALSGVVMILADIPAFLAYLANG